jgi:lipid-binding SYLF domain-containing protein
MKLQMSPHLAARSAVAVVIASLFAFSSFAETPEKRIRSAADSFLEIMKVPEKGIPRDLLEKAECVVIIPGLKKGAFLVGGKYGRGFVSCRRRSERWGPPAAVRIEGGSYGFQIGGSSTDVFMLIMNEKGMKRLLSDKFTIGGEAAAAAGPVGRNASANTDMLLRAEILSWSRSRGLFAGLSLEGATLRPDGDANRDLYGRDLSNQEIIEGDVRTPRAARPLIAALNQYSGPAGKDESVSQSLKQRGRATLGAAHFETGKSEITSDSEAALSDFAKTLTDNPTWNIRVEGYTDNRGNAEANRKLSEDRAQAVVNWLTEHGIDRSRLTVKGYGQSRPVGSNATDTGRQKNRRVEVVRLTAPLKQK